MPNQRLTTFVPWLLLSGLWTAMIAALIVGVLFEYQKRIIYNAEILADASHETDVLYRHWVSEQGGVYIPITEKIQPNEYLAQAKEREIKTPAGVRLTLVNPAYMIRKVHESGIEKLNVQGRVTSLTPLRPENIADSWEAQGLKLFAKGQTTQVFEKTEINGEPFLRALYPLHAQPSCLGCHTEQGYQTGDLCGGTSIKIPLSPYLPTYNRARNIHLTVLAAIWLLGLTLLSWSINIIRKQVINLENSRAQTELAETRYRHLFDGAEYGIAIIDPNKGKIIECNQKLCELVDKTQQQLIGAQQNCLPEVDDLQTTLEGKEIKLQNAGGKTSYVDVKKRIITLAGKRVSEILFYDRTYEKLNAQKLLASAQRINDIFQAAQNVSFIIAAKTEEAPIIEFSPGAEKIFGYRKEDVIGQPVSMLHSANTNIPIMQQQMKANQVAFSGRIELVRKSGEVFPALFTLYPLFDENQQLYGGLGVSIDISDLQKLEDRLSQTQKMEAIGTLAGGIAHDFNNILSIIFGYTQLAARHIEPDSKALKHLETIESAATRAKELVGQILTFSRKSNNVKQCLSLQTIVKEALKMLRATLPKTIIVKESIDTGSSPVIADPSQMHQVLMNICTNAYHAMRETGGILHVSLNEVKVDASLATKHPDLSTGYYVKLQVSDTGTGIDTETLPQIFDPFFTTKQSQNGTGMGLSVVHGIIKNNGGAILVETEPGQGTIFDIYLPKATPDEAKPEINETEITGMEKILMVDDEPLLAALGRDLLTALGYKVKITTDGRRALKIFEQNPEEFDLVITDQTMPFMTGAELTKALLQVRADLPVIIYTGFSDLLNKENVTKCGARALLDKPLQKNQLAKTIREILDTD